MDRTIEGYGTDTCKDTNATRRHLEELGADFEYINIEADQAAAKKVEEWNAGDRKTPTVVLSTADDCGRLVILSVTGDTELDVELDKALALYPWRRLDRTLCQPLRVPLRALAPRASRCCEQLRNG